MKFKLLLLFALVLGALCGERIGLIGQCVREKDLAVTFDIAGSQRAEIVLELIHRLEAVVTVFMDPRVFTHEEYSEVCHKAEEYNCEVSEMPLNGYEGMDIDTLKSMVVSSHRRLNELTSTMDPKIYLNHPEMFDADAVQTMMALGMVMMSEKTSSLGLLKEMLINGHVNGMDQALEDLLHGWHGPTGQPMIMFDEVEDADLMTFVPFLVAGIKNKGYHFVTADQCLHGYECENDDCNDDGAPDWKEEYDEKLDTVVGQCVDDHSFALTFDGCVDDDVLALLDKHHIKATFFVHPHDLTTPSKQSAYRKMHDHGHTVGILSDDYEHMTMDQLWEEVPDDKEYLKKCTGRRPHYYMRPLSSPRLTYELIDMKMTCVGWGAETDFVDPQMLMGIKEAHLPGLLKPHMRAWTVGGRPMILGVTKCHPGMLRFLKVLIDFIKHDSEGYHFVNMDQCMLGRDEDSEYSSYETSSSEYVSDPNTYSEVTQDSENSDSDLDDSHPYIEGDEPVDWEESESYVGSTGGVATGSGAMGSGNGSGYNSGSSSTSTGNGSTSSGSTSSGSTGGTGSTAGSTAGSSSSSSEAGSNGGTVIDGGNNPATTEGSSSSSGSSSGSLAGSNTGGIDGLPTGGDAASSSQIAMGVALVAALIAVIML